MEDIHRQSTPEIIADRVFFSIAAKDNKLIIGVVLRITFERRKRSKNVSYSGRHRLRYNKMLRKNCEQLCVALELAQFQCDPNLIVLRQRAFQAVPKIFLSKLSRRIWQRWIQQKPK